MATLYEIRMHTQRNGRLLGLTVCIQARHRNQEWHSFAEKVKSVSVSICVCVSSTGYQMASCVAQLPSALLSPEGERLVTHRAGTQGHGCVCPETRLLSCGSIRDKDPSSPGGYRDLQRPVRLSCSQGYRGLWYDLHVLYTHKHTHIHKPTEQPVFRAPQDYCFDSQGEKIVIERTSDTCAVMSWRGDTGNTHTHACTNTRLRARSMSSQ